MFSGNIKAKTVTTLKRYYLSGLELPAEYGGGFHGMRPFFMIFLHPSSDKTILREILMNSQNIETTCDKYFSRTTNIKTPFGREGPRSKLIAKLLFEQYIQFVSEENSKFLKMSYFVKNYAMYVRFYLSSKIIDPYVNTPYLLDEFIKCIGDLIREDINIIIDESTRNWVRGKYVETTNFKLLVDVATNFTIDKMPHHRVLSTTEFVDKLRQHMNEEPLKTLIKHFLG